MIITTGTDVSFHTQMEVVIRQVSGVVKELVIFMTSIQGFANLPGPCCIIGEPCLNTVSSMSSSKSSIHLYQALLLAKLR